MKNKSPSYVKRPSPAANLSYSLSDTKRPTAVLLAMVVFGLASPAHSQTIWTGNTDNDFNTASNWSSGLPNTVGNNGTISSGTPVIDSNVDMNITQSAGTVTVGGTRRFDSGTWNANGGSLDVASAGLWVISGGDYIVNGGTLTNTAASAAEVLRIEDGSLQILSGTQNLNGGNVAHRSGIVLIDNASLVTTGTFSFAINGTTINPMLTIQNGATLDVGTLSYGASNATGYGQVSFDGTFSSITAGTWNTGRSTEWNINFESSATGSTFTIETGFFSASEWETQWDNGKLTVDGANGGTFTDYFDVTGDTLTFTVPEPSTCLLMVGGVAVLLFKRRRLR